VKKKAFDENLIWFDLIYGV